jgi:uncharacterized BrkB/YihY/UPF0761 family membrane protein
MLMKRAIIILISLLLCGVWFFITMAEKGDQVHKHIVIDSKSIGIWVLGWIPILIVTYFLIRKKKSN